MSWTMHPLKEDEGKLEKEVRKVITEAYEKNIIMFCAVDDGRPAKDESFPGSICPSQVIRIGAADKAGNAWEFTPGHSDYILPGLKIKAEYGKEDDSRRPLTGSSVAAALAAGLGGLILYCVQMSAILAYKDPQRALLDIKEYKALRGSFQKMKDAFRNIGTNLESGSTFIRVWELFDLAAEKINSSRNSNDDKCLELAQLGRDIVRHTQ